MTSANQNEGDTAQRKVKEFFLQHKLKWEERPQYLRGDIENHFPANKYNGKPLSNFFTQNTPVAKKPVPAPAIPLNCPGKMTPIGWQPPTKKLDLNTWVKCGKAFSQIEGAVQWWLGDWWTYGEHAYGERKALFEEGGSLEGLNFQTIADYGWVANSVETSLRNEVLSFQHHKVLAPLPRAQQRKWLERAVKEDWSARQLKSAIADEAAEDTEADDDWTVIAERRVGEAVEAAEVAYADETVRPSGGQAVDVENPAAQEQTAKALTVTEATPTERTFDKTLYENSL